LNITKIQAENDEFYEQNIQKAESGKISIEEILGIPIAAPRVFIPRVNCRFISPSGDLTKTSSELHSIFSLCPTYNSVVLPIRAKYENGKITERNFERANGISLKNFLTFIERGRVIPYFETGLKNYDQKLLEHFLEPGLPRISWTQIELIRKHNMCSFTGGDCKKCNNLATEAKKDMTAVGATGKDLSECAPCLSSLYMWGVKKESIPHYAGHQNPLCAMVDFVAARNLDAVFSSSCPIGKSAVNAFYSSSTTTEKIDAIVTGLKIKYSPDLDLESYLDLLDEKTTRAIRKIIEEITKAPFVAENSERLNARIYAFNREIDEIGKSSASKIYRAVSDIAVMGVSKGIENQTQSLVKINKNTARDASEWLASKFIDVNAAIHGKSWAIAQLYRTRCKIETCKKDKSGVCDSK
jgi:hypothetical protein